jgi:Subtilisin inhibitor-like
MNEAQPEALERLPAPQSCWVIDFEKAEIFVLESFPPQYVLVVSGTKPYVNMKVDLVPLVYIQQPEYWGIEVVGCLPGIGLPATAHYTVSLPLADLTGTEGIEVIGASRHQQIRVPPTQETPQGSFRLFITSPTGDLIAKASLTCNPAGDSHPNPEAACEQLTKADGYIEAIPEKQGFCQAIFKPVILSASGTWGGQERNFKREFSNQCEAVLATGGVVFDFKGASPAPAELLFSRDDRPVDGELRELKVIPEDGSTLIATLHTAHIDLIKQQEIDQTEELASGLTCSITDAEVTCSRDDRPVDGQLKELAVSRNEEGTFDATLRTAFFDRVNGKEVDETADIGTGLIKR